jgi:tRNA isopentenyl-2-thiomethyl-A-37 hydroxylase MiaE
MECPRASIVMVPDVDGVLIHLVHNYGQLTPEDISAFVATFIGQETRQAQNYVQLDYCIANTMDERGHLRIVSEAESYTMEGTHSGIMLFKLIM